MIWLQRIGVLLLLFIIFLLLDGFLNFHSSRFKFEFSVAIPAIYMTLRRNFLCPYAFLMFGIVEDSYSTGIFGVYAMAYFLGGVILYYVSALYVTESYLMVMIFIFLSDLVIHFLSITVIYMTEKISFYGLLIPEVIPFKIIPTAVIAIPLFILLEKFLLSRNTYAN